MSRASSGRDQCFTEFMEKIEVPAFLFNHDIDRSMKFNENDMQYITCLLAF